MGLNIVAERHQERDPAPSRIDLSDLKNAASVDELHLVNMFPWPAAQKLYWFTCYSYSLQIQQNFNGTRDCMPLFRVPSICTVTTQISQAVSSRNSTIDICKKTYASGRVISFTTVRYTSIILNQGAPHLMASTPFSLPLPRF